MASQGPTAGVAATSSVQVTDATTPANSESVDTTGAAKTQPTTITPSGIRNTVPLSTDEAGRIQLAAEEKLSLILAELRLHSVILATMAGFSFDDVEQMRQDASLTPFDSSPPGAS